MLSNSNRGLTGQVVDARDWTYYERLIYAVNCSTNFECPSGKCIDKEKVRFTDLLFVIR